MRFHLEKTARFAPSYLATAIIVLAFSVASVPAASVTINPVEDNTIYQGADASENYEDNSCGAGTNLFAGVTNDGFLRRALLQFDIAGNVPAGSTINRVTLTINVNRSGDNQDAPMSLHPVSLDWGEGTADCDAIRGGGQGIDADSGDATWLDAMFQQVAWTNPGGDFGPASGTATIPTRGDGTWDSVDAGNGGMASDVQGWLDAPGTNQGWIVVGDEGRVSTTRRFGSREGSPAPSLTIDFTPVGDVFACCFEDGTCTVQDTETCTSQGGTPDTTTNTCDPNPCPQPVGACCNLDESCSDSVERQTCEASGGVFQGAGSLCSDNQVNCGLEPFVDALPLPAVLQPVGTRQDGVPQYEITMTETRQQLHRDLPATDVWTYNGTFPGPTIEATVGQPIEVKYINDLPTGGGNRGGHYLEVDECAHGPSYWQDTARTVVHLHGGHVPARVDGLPEYDFMPGEFDVYEYPNAQLPATLWYHDHALGITRLNVYMGMAAYYLLRDDFENGLGLPSGEFEVPLVLQDREFNPDGTFFYPPTIQDGFFGDKLLVNGKVWPYFEVKQGKYRFRFLNGSQARSYRLRLENLDSPSQVIPFELIGTDGGLISAPITLDSFLMAPAERFDVVVDFAGFPAGTEIVLRNDQGTPPRLPNAMKFIVTGEPGDTSPLPSTLRTVPPIPQSQAAETRRFLLERVAEPCAGGEWLIKSLDAQGNVIGEHWDDITEFPITGTTEIWEFENPSNVMHPMHVHLVQFQVIDRSRIGGQSLPLEPWEDTTWKDTVRVPPNTTVRVIATFEDYLGKFPYHCHILDHEDHEMMRQFQTTNDPANCNFDGTCGEGEDCISCPDDCAQVSGALCGNGLCETGDNESFDNCPQDCAGKTKGKAAFKCGNPAMDPSYVGCDDPRCTDGFFCRTAPRVAACCGDSLCEGQEDETSCALDCAGEPGPCVPTSNREREKRGECNDGLDNDCDRLIDGADPDCGGTRCTDDDNDSYAIEGGDCGPVDCNDNEPAINPGAAEVCDDLVDNDCDGLIDADDPDCQVVDCSVYSDKASCNGDPACRWDNRNKLCVPR